jgi:hypothetical protein
MQALFPTPTSAPDAAARRSHRRFERRHWSPWIGAAAAVDRHARVHPAFEGPLRRGCGDAAARGERRSGGGVHGDPLRDAPRTSSSCGQASRAAALGRVDRRGERGGGDGIQSAAQLYRDGSRRRAAEYEAAFPPRSTMPPATPALEDAPAGACWPATRRAAAAASTAPGAKAGNDVAPRPRWSAGCPVQQRRGSGGVGERQPGTGAGPGARADDPTQPAR